MRLNKRFTPIVIALLLGCTEGQGAEAVGGPLPSVIECTGVVTISVTEFDSPVPHNSTGNEALFSVSNSSDSATVVAVGCSSQLFVTCTGTTPSTFTLAGHGEQNVTTTFSAASSGIKGFVKLSGCGAEATAGPIFLVD
jgi:hypothetical protein